MERTLNRANLDMKNYLKAIERLLQEEHNVSI